MNILTMAKLKLRKIETKVFGPKEHYKHATINYSTF